MKPLNWVIKIVIADDHVYVRDGLREMLEACQGIDVVGVVSDGSELLKAVELKQPDIIITDIRMPVMDGIKAAEIINEHYPGIGMIAISADDQAYPLLRLLEASFKGIVLKSSEKFETYNAVQQVYKGEPYYCRGSFEKIQELVEIGLYQPQKMRVKKLITEREKDILVMICKGMKSKEIANELRLSERTIETYREKLKEKTGSANVANLVEWAVKNGMM